LKNVTLIFDDKCAICRRLATDVKKYSYGLIRALPLDSGESKELLHKLYGEHPPNSFFLIQQDGSYIQVSYGIRAAFKIASLVGLKNAVRLFASYLDYHRVLRRSLRSNICCNNGTIAINVAKRRTLNFLIRGGVLLAFYALLGSWLIPKTLGEQRERPIRIIETRRVAGEEKRNILGGVISDNDFLNAMHWLIRNSFTPQINDASVEHIFAQAGETQLVFLKVQIPFRGEGDPQLLFIRGIEGPLKDEKVALASYISPDGHQHGFASKDGITREVTYGSHDPLGCGICLARCVVLTCWTCWIACAYASTGVGVALCLVCTLVSCPFCFTGCYSYCR
jgi:hypothetical protein